MNDDDKIVSFEDAQDRRSEAELERPIRRIGPTFGSGRLRS